MGDGRSLEEESGDDGRSGVGVGWGDRKRWWSAAMCCRSDGRRAMGASVTGLAGAVTAGEALGGVGAMLTISGGAWSWARDDSG